MNWQNDLVVYSFPEIRIEKNIKGEWKKRAIGLPKEWQKLTESKIIEGHKCKALLTGKVSNVLVLDFDVKTTEQEDKWEKYHDDIYKTPYVRTKRGYHYYFKWEDRFVDLAGSYDGFIDIQGNGKQVYFPGTTYYDQENETHFTYSWYPEEPAPEIQLMKLPDHLFELFVKKNKSNIPKATAKQFGKFEGFHKDILVNINPELYYNYPDWCKFIWAIKFSFDNQQKAFEIAVYFSGQLANYTNEDSVKCKMEQANDARIGWGYLMNLSKQSNITQHFRIISQYNDFVKPDDYYIAKSAINLVDDNVVKLDDNEFYIYKNPYWERNKGGILRAYLCSLLREYYAYVLRDITEEMKKKCDDESHYKALIDLKKLVDRVLEKVNSSNHSKSIYDKFCINMRLSDIDFDTYKPYYFCFTNCAFDLQTNKPVTVKREHYITQTTGYAYMKSTPEQLENIKGLFDSVFYDSHDKKLSYISTLRSAMIGKFFEKFILANGLGRNGKGAINEMLEWTLGKEYFYKASPITLTQDEKGGANPELANMHKKRCVLTQEPKEGSSLNLGMIKRLTGGGNINARQCYSNKTEVTLQLTLMFECNTKPSFNGRIDESIIQRFINYVFNANFTDDEEKLKNIPGYFPLNKKYKNTEWQKEHRCAFFDYMLHYEYIDIVEHKEIKQATHKYLCEQDDFTMWLDQHYQLIEDKTQFVRLKDMCNLYKETFLKVGSKEYRRMNMARFLEKLQENIKWKSIVHERFKTDHKPCQRFVGVVLNKSDSDNSDEDNED